MTHEEMWADIEAWLTRLEASPPTSPLLRSVIRETIEGLDFIPPCVLHAGCDGKVGEFRKRMERLLQ